MAQTGMDFVIRVPSNGTNQEIIAGQRNCTISRSAATIDAHTKDDSGWGATIAGLRNWTITGDAVYVSTANAINYLKTEFAAGNAVNVQVFGKTANNAVYAGSAYITSLEYSMPSEDVMTLSITLSGNGAPTTSTI
jgi:TP901-1 family phage major tail protein